MEAGQVKDIAPGPDKRMEKRTNSVRRKILGVIFVWVTIAGGSFVWNYYSAGTAREEIALETARSFFEEVVRTRRWNAGHGGVYVPVTETTPPNPYLDVRGRDIVVGPNLMLTRINPAYMTRQISEIATGEKGIKFHITSLLPLRPENKPSPLEREALEAFQRGERKVGKFIQGKGEETFFYMAPLFTEKACLICHGKQGYKEGDIRGGISITLPFTPRIPLFTLLAGHLGIGLAGIIGIVVFGERLKKYTVMLQRQAVFDALTGIPNRRSFSETILREFRRAKREHLPLSLIMCDIDKFKGYNDRYGHAAGDECLTKVAGAIAQSLNRGGDFCARYGGEEFVIVLPNTRLEDAMHVAGKIRETVQALGIVHEASSPLKTITLSLGVATMEEGIVPSDEWLIKHADEALYRAKEKGLNRAEAYQDIQ